MMTITLAAVYLLPLGPAAESGYPNPKLLVEPEVLAKSPQKFRILDVRPTEEFKKGHAPGAISVQLGPWSKAVNAGKADAEFWKKELARAVVSRNVPVVVVADDVRAAARGWWLLSLAGVEDVRLLNGGWGAYRSAKGRVTTDAISAAVRPEDWAPAPERQATKDDVLGIVNKKRPGQIIDARSAEEYEAGHVPGAVRLEWSEVIDPRTGKFKPAAELAKLLKERDIDPAEESCSY
jgi:thiosulfate/3-mercaptopyruvate sulfurtransferase